MHHVTITKTFSGRSSKSQLFKNYPSLEPIVTINYFISCFYNHNTLEFLFRVKKKVPVCVELIFISTICFYDPKTFLIALQMEKQK